MGHLASLPGKLVPQGPSCLLRTDAFKRPASLRRRLAQAARPGGAGSTECVMHFWAPQGKNSFALLGWVVTHTLAWQPACWKGKCQTISGCQNKPLPGPNIQPPDSSKNSPLSHSFRPESREKKALCPHDFSFCYPQPQQPQPLQKTHTYSSRPWSLNKAQHKKVVAGIFFIFQHFPHTKHHNRHVAFIPSSIHSRPGRHL